MSENDQDAFPVRVGNAIVCEDIRVEFGGKHSLLGVYPGDILVPEFTNFLKIAVFIELFAKQIGPVKLDAIISYAGNDIMKVTMEFDFKELRDPALIVSPAFPMPLTGPGSITVTATHREQEKCLMKKEVRASEALRQAILSSTVPVPPGVQSLNVVAQGAPPPAPRRPSRRRRGGKP